MKYAKALQDHIYNSKRRRVGEIYPIRRADFRLLHTLGRIEIVPNPNESVIEPVQEIYLTRALEAEPEPVRVKRPYRRKAKVVEE